MNPLRKKYPFIRAILGLLLLLMSGPYALLSQFATNWNSPLAVSQYSIENYDIRSGLPSNGVPDGLQTRDGYLWFATFNGLVRFDGVHFRVFRKTDVPVMETHAILSLFEDREGTLWVGTNGAGLLKYVDGTFSAIPLPEGFLSPSVTALAQDHSGSLWIGTRSGVVCYKNGKFSYPLLPESLKRASIRSILAPSDGDIWVGATGAGLFQLSEGNWKQYGTDEGLVHNSVRSIFQDSKGAIWVGTEQGATRLGADNIRSFTFADGLPHSFVNTICEDAEGSIWLGTDEGIARIHNGKIQSLSGQTGISGATVESLFIDSDQNLWASTYRHGIIRLKKGKFINIGTVEGLPDPVINVIMEDTDHTTWIGMEKGLARIQDGKITNFSLGPKPAENRVRHIMRDSRERLWIATYGGLVEFDGQVVQRITTENGLPDQNIRRVIEDASGALWVGTRNGLCRIDGDNIRTFGPDDGLTNSYVLSLMRDSRNRIWIGSNGGGLFCFTGKEFRRYAQADGLNAEVVFDMYEDVENTIWVSTSNGICRFDETRFQSSDLSAILPAQSVFQTLEDPWGNMWMTTGNGLLQIRKADLEAFINGQTKTIPDYQLFDRSEGLGSDEITAASVASFSKKQGLWIPTLEGISILYPHRIPQNKVPPVVYLEEILVDQQPVDKHNPLTVSPGQHRYEFRYTGLSYDAPEKIRFKYRIEGFDDDWIDAGTERIAHYTNLPAGEFVFRVIAANNNGIWNEAGTAFRFNRKASYTESPWFLPISIFISLMGLGLILLFRFRNQRIGNRKLQELIREGTVDIRRQNEEILRQNEEISRQNYEIGRQKEALEGLNQIKDKLFSIISHDLRGPLSSLGGILNLMHGGYLSDQEFEELAIKVENELSQLNNLMDNLLHWSTSQMQGIEARKTPFGVRPVIQETLQLLEPLATRKGIQLRLEPGLILTAIADEEMIKLVIRNLVSNAIKFSRLGDQIRVSAIPSDKWVIISVQDSGVGMNPEEVSRLFNPDIAFTRIGTSSEAGTGLGFMLCKEFVEMNGGSIQVESVEGEGSVFSFTLEKAEHQKRSLTRLRKIKGTPKPPQIQ